MVEGNGSGLLVGLGQPGFQLCIDVIRRRESDLVRAHGSRLFLQQTVGAGGALEIQPQINPAFR